MKISTKICVIIRLSSLNTSLIYIKREVFFFKITKYWIKLKLRETRRAEVGVGDRGRMGGRGPWHWVEWVNRESTGECRLESRASTCSPCPNIWVHVWDPHDTCDVYTRVRRHVPCYLCCGNVSNVCGKWLRANVGASIHSPEPEPGHWSETLLRLRAPTLASCDLILPRGGGSQAPMSTPPHKKSQTCCDQKDILSPRKCKI